ncbi:YwiC-like family protein [Myxosarcina sp. GI1(2024)]
MTSIATHSHLPKSQQLYRPTFSPEHGVYVMLIVSFLTGAAAAQQWTWGTTLGLICAFCGFQAEHPLVWQIKQPKSWKPRLLVWASFYNSSYWHDFPNCARSLATKYIILFHCHFYR